MSNFKNLVVLPDGSSISPMSVGRVTATKQGKVIVKNYRGEIEAVFDNLNGKHNEVVKLINEQINSSHAREPIDWESVLNGSGSAIIEEDVVTTAIRTVNV